jgi:hypothetical protein
MSQLKFGIIKLTKRRSGNWSLFYICRASGLFCGGCRLCIHHGVIENLPKNIITTAGYSGAVKRLPLAYM